MMGDPMLRAWWLFWAGCIFGQMLRFLEPTAAIAAFCLVGIVFILAALAGLKAHNK